MTMRELLVPLLLTCGPALLSTAALVETFLLYRKGQLRLYPMLMVGGASLVSAYAAYVFLRYTLVPPPGSPPPWKDPETLDLAMLFFLAPIGLGLTIAAGMRGASRWAVIALVIALFVLFAVGMMEGISV
jgi:hypothetical protein